MCTLKSPEKILSIHLFLLWKSIVFICLLDIFSGLEIIVIYEKGNIWRQESLLFLSEEFNNFVDWHYCEYQETLYCFKIYENSELILDLTSRIETQFFVLELCEERNIPHLFLENKLNSANQLTFSLLPSHLDQINAFIAVLRNFGWTQGVVANDENTISLQKHLKHYSENLNYLAIESGVDVDELVNRAIAPLGATLYYIFLSSAKSNEIQRALISTKLLIKGNGIILDQKVGIRP